MSFLVNEFLEHAVDGVVHLGVQMVNLAARLRDGPRDDLAVRCG